MELTGWEHDQSPYHPGEQELHDRLGRKDAQERAGRNIHRPYMPQQHRDFFAQLPFFVAGAIDAQGDPWATVLFGQPGFISTPDDRTLRINAAPLPGDALANAFAPGDAVGFVGVELETRRRNRVNGVVTAGDEHGFSVGVVQSFGNCPQYIHTRKSEIKTNLQQTTTQPAVNFSDIDANLATVIEKADTFFVASYNNRDDKFINGGADVNHRGGKPGFIKVKGNTLTIPDYVGNFAFNTLGNFLVNPKAGLMFIDFDSGDIYQLTGTAELLWDKTDEISHFRGAERAWRFHLVRGVHQKGASHLKWEKGEPSPNSLLTGDWASTQKAWEAQSRRREWRPYSVVKIDDESQVIRSLYLQPADNGGAFDYLPGQYLTLRVTPNGGEPVIRTYTLSSSPSDPSYRISVKRESDGLVSCHLHNELKVGDTIEALAPNGSFWMDTQNSRPAVLLAAGVGITPMIAMAREVYHEGIRRRYLRSTTVFHAARSTADRAFADEFSHLQQSTDGAIRYLSLISQPAPDELPGNQFHIAGRLTRDTLQRVLPIADYDFYLCGPADFMQSTYDILIELGVRDARIHSESFGPATLNRIKVDKVVPPEPVAQPVTQAVVRFSQSDMDQTWTEDDGTLLELAETHGLKPTYGCRSGACGSCAVKKRSGEVRYINEPSFLKESDEVLLCCAVPAESDSTLVLEL